MITNPLYPRFPPQSEWRVNTGLGPALALLKPVKLQHGPGLAWADLIVLAGTTALEQEGAISLHIVTFWIETDSFCSLMLFVLVSLDFLSEKYVFAANFC